jgi:hypothetical protein
MSFKHVLCIGCATLALSGCTSMAQRDRLVDPQTWVAKSNMTPKKTVNEAIDNCYLVYMKGRSQYQAEQVFKEYRRCMDVAGYDEVVSNSK